MNYASALEIFNAQAKNVRTLKLAIHHLNRSINYDLRSGDRVSVSVHTKVLALTFSAWAEARFSQLIHTPHGFTLDEIAQIKTAHQQHGLESGWRRCLDLALRKVSGSSKGSEIPNKRQKIWEIIMTYIIEPSLLRNKIAHGQWQEALNRNNDARNQDFTDKLNDLNVITITIWIKAYEYIAKIIEDLIESPNRAFRRDYWLHLTELENFLEKSKQWTLESKIQKLKHKPVHK